MAAESWASALEITAKDGERLMMRVPETIWLLDDGDGISWCNDPDPCGLQEEAPDSTQYFRADVLRQVEGVLESLQNKFAQVTAENETLRERLEEVEAKYKRALKDLVKCSTGR